MLTTIKDAGSELLTNPQVGWSAAIILQFKVHWEQWGSPLIDGLSTVAGLILVCVLIYKNIQGIKKDKVDKG